MLDRTIPFYNIILRCDRYLTTTPVLHNRYEFRMYQDGHNLNMKLETLIQLMKQSSISFQLIVQKRLLILQKDVYL